MHYKFFSTRELEVHRRGRTLLWFLGSMPITKDEILRGLHDEHLWEVEWEIRNKNHHVTPIQKVREWNRVTARLFACDCVDRVINLLTEEEARRVCRNVVGDVRAHAYGHYALRTQTLPKARDRVKELPIQTSIDNYVIQAVWEMARDNWWETTRESSDFARHVTARIFADSVSEPSKDAWWDAMRVAGNIETRWQQRQLLGDKYLKLL